MLFFYFALNSDLNIRPCPVPCTLTAHVVTALSLGCLIRKKEVSFSPVIEAQVTLLTGHPKVSQLSAEAHVSNCDKYQEPKGITSWKSTTSYHLIPKLDFEPPYQFNLIYPSIQPLRLPKNSPCFLCSTMKLLCLCGAYGSSDVGLDSSTALKS